MDSSSGPFGDKDKSFFRDIIWLLSKLRSKNKSTEFEQISHQNARSGSNDSFQSHSVRQANVSRSQYSTAKTTFQLVIAAIVAAIPIGFYLLQPANFQDAIAAVGDKVKQNTTINTRVKSTQANVEEDSERLNKLLDAKKAQRDIETDELDIDKKPTPSESVKDVMQETALEHAAKHADPTYVCPMHPDVISNDPNAICPICGMDLVLVEAGGETGVVNLKPSIINTLGVRTAKAKLRTLYRKIDSVGYIEVDENNIREISLRTEGWVERLVYKSAGERVVKGELLFEVYSPKLVNAQEEYVHAKEHDNLTLLKASEERLRALGVSDEQILTLDSSGTVEPLVKVYAPQSGVITRLNVREGRYIKPSQSVIDLVDLSSVWLIVDVFERQVDWVEEGQRAEAKLPFIPGRSWEGKVEYVYPSLDAASRSLKVRLRFDNLNEDLKPNMYADVTIFAKPKKKVLSIPKEALIRTGKNDRVIVSMGKGKFMPMPVRVGMETESRVEILGGLGEGDEVVTSSQFLIDSESSLKASLSRMAGGS